MTVGERVPGVPVDSDFVIDRQLAIGYPSPKCVPRPVAEAFDLAIVPNAPIRKENTNNLVRNSVGFADFCLKPNPIHGAPFQNLDSGFLFS